MDFGLIRVLFTRQWSSDYEDDDIQKRDGYHNLERSSEYKSHRDKGKALSNSEESHGRKLQKHPDQKLKSDHRRYEKCGHSTNDRRDHGSYHTDRSVSEVDDVHSGNYRYDEVRHKKYHESSRRRHNSREQSDSDCSCSRHQIKKEKDVKRRETRDTWKTVNDTDEDHHHNKRKRVR